MPLNARPSSSWYRFTTVRAKLLLAFSLFSGVVLLMSSLFGGYYYFEKRAEKLFIDITQMQMKLTKAKALSKDFFLYETINPAFYKKGKSDLLGQHELLFIEIEQMLQALSEQSTMEKIMLQQNLTSTQQKIADLEEAFEDLHQKMLKRGFKDFGLEGDMREAIHQLESYQDQLDLAKILTIRRHEKDFFLRKDPKYEQRLEEAVLALNQEIVEKIADPQTRQNLLDTLWLYQDKFHQIVLLEEAMGFDNTTALRGRITRLSIQIDDLIHNICDTIYEEVRQTRQRLRSVLISLILFIFLVITLLGFQMARKLSKPIKELSQAIHQVIAYDFRTELPKISYRSKDEIGYLIKDFTYMFEKLKEHDEEIRQQNEEIIQQNEEIASQRDALSKNNQELYFIQQELKKKNTELDILNNSLDQKVKERTRELTQTNEELDLFIYRASHDLKGPIARLEGLIQLAQMESGEPVAQLYFDKLAINVEEMEHLLDKLMTINVIHQQIRRYRSVDFKQIWQEARQRLEKLIKKTGVPIKLEILYEREFSTDRDLFILIAQNLVENALLYHRPDAQPPPYIKVKFSCTQNHLLLEVYDNGQGIPTTIQSKIYQMFFRGIEISRGNGLGLYITRKAVDALKGTIELESAVNAYTRFLVKIPYRHQKLDAQQDA